MHLAAIDWLIVVVSIAVSFLPAIVLARRAGSSTAEFFTSGRAAPWWLVGVSMVATTFSTDTPNLVTNLVREHGVANNWAWWAFLLTGMLTVFFYARLWRRSGVLTDLEFYELRYGGRPASVVRGFRAVYLGLLFNCVIMATVNLALIGHDMAYPAMLRFLPRGLLGLMVAGLLAAYVSTMSTHLNWGTSYLVHDLYRRFIRPGRDERHYVLAGRIVTALLMVCAASLTFVLDTARSAFQLMLSVGAGTGLIYLLRWFWWRVNAWCEIAVMASSFLIAAGFALAARSGSA